MNLKYFVLILGLLSVSCGAAPTGAQTSIVVGAERFGEVLAALGTQRVGVVVNHTSMSRDTHLVDRLVAHGVELQKVFAPEHGFRGVASDGEVVKDDIDLQTGLPIISLYGKTKRPTADMFAGLDVVVFDIQDVGARFYTYISTLHHVMDAAAEYGVQVLVLDRPNPNGGYVDGPVLDTAFRSFIGMHEIPVVHGLTVGELAGMINGEGWLPGGRKVELRVIEVANYAVGSPYQLPIPPSPNLPNQRSVYLYPSLCWFEGTVVSVGRGTDFPFQVYGNPSYPDTGFAFTPEARPGAAYAKLKGERCYGVDLRGVDAAKLQRIDLTHLLAMRDSLGVDGFIDRPEHFDLLAGSDVLRKQIEAGRGEEEIRRSWRGGIAEYLQRREPYLLYPRKD